MRLGWLLELDDRSGSTIESTARIAHAAIRITRPHLEALVVVEGAHPIGIVTRGDIIESVISGGRSLHDTPITDIMTAEVVTAQADLELEEALELMAENDVHYLPVFRGDEYLGLVGLADLTCWLVIDLEAQIADPLFYLTRRKR